MQRPDGRKVRMFKIPLPGVGLGREGAGATGLEPATSGVTGRRSNRLSYAPSEPRLVKQSAPPPEEAETAWPAQLAPVVRCFRRRQPIHKEVGLWGIVPSGSPLV